MSAPEMPVKLWAPWHPEHGIGQAYGAIAFGDLDSAAEAARAKQILDNDDRWKAIPVFLAMAPCGLPANRHIAAMP